MSRFARITEDPEYYEDIVDEDFWDSNEDYEQEQNWLERQIEHFTNNN